MVDSSNNSLLIPSAALAALLVFGGLWFLFGSSEPDKNFGDDVENPKEIVDNFAPSGVERWYTNQELQFSFRIPDGFYAPEFNTKAEGVTGIAVYNDTEDTAIILVYPVTSGVSISEAGVRENLPGVAISNVREDFIGAVVKGIYFYTDAKEWGGDGVAFWFAYNGRLYQLQTDRKNEALLNFIIRNWQFAPPAPST